MAESHPPAPAQLLVLDVYVNLPKPKQAPTKRGSSGGAAVEDIKENFVEVHQVIGIFPCDIEKSPANLDTGLLDYEFFYNTHLQQCKAPPPPTAVPQMSGSSANLTRSNSVMSNSSSGGGKDAGVVVWSQPHPSSGICIGKSVLPSGKEFQFQLLGNAPSRDYLNNNLPKKVKEWLGINSNTSYL